MIKRSITEGNISLINVYVSNIWGFSGGSDGKAPLPAMLETWVRYLGQEDPLQKDMATHFSTLAWKIPWTEEPGGLQFMRSQSLTQLSNYISHYNGEVENSKQKLYDSKNLKYISPALHKKVC